MATRNKYVYWGTWGLPIAGVMGRTVVPSRVTIGALVGKVTLLLTQAKVQVLRWQGGVRRVGK